VLSEIDLLVRLVLAAGLGGLVGFEREMKDEPAGFRTHILVCMGAALFTIISIQFVGPYEDPSRIAAGIVTGIGFLGAGAIFRAKDGVKGLTTAADIWTISAIGVAVGIGYFLAAVITTLLVFVVLLFGRAVKERKQKLKKIVTVF
jgi:putative Mg2+ transporter-C (MgtC) family protein